MSIEQANEVAVHIEVWVAGRSKREALSRREAVIGHMVAGGAEEVGSGYGDFWYRLWQSHSGADPLAGEGTHIADAEFELVPISKPADLKGLGRTITADLEGGLGFPVAVHVTWEDEPVSGGVV